MTEEVIKIFYSYSRKDLEMRNTLESHLSALKKAKKIQTWHDLELEAGTEWERNIQQQLNTADIILLLVSSSFMASDYCYSTELQVAIDRHNAGTARVIPVILRPCDWNHEDVPFSKLNVLPTHAKPITGWQDPEEAYAIVAQKIRETVEQLRKQKQTKQRQRLALEEQAAKQQKQL
jgi:TIR domain